MKYILDTNTVSFLMRGDRAVVAQLLKQARTDVLIPQPVCAEIEFGLARLPKSKRRDRLRARFDLIVREMDRAVWDNAGSAQFGEVKAKLQRAGTPLEDFDVVIAAHALALDATLVSGDLEQMSRIRGLRLENWTASS